MAHPHNELRQHKVERARVGHITKGYASGGAVAKASAESAGPKRVSGGSVKPKLATGGAAVKPRMDRRARGGRTKHKGNNVNVIVSPQSGAQHAAMPMVPPPPAGVAPPMAGAPPMRPPIMPPGGAMPPPGMPAGGPPMPIRSGGGRTYAKGGAVKSGPTWAEGVRNGTQVTHSPGKNDQAGLNRGKPITYKTGGAINAKPTGQMGPKFEGGAGGGEARMDKAERAAKKYKRA